VFAEAANWAGGVVVEAAARLIASARICNLILSNVPGRARRSTRGARMREVYLERDIVQRFEAGLAELSTVGAKPAAAIA